jgi:hypothetical protein
MFSSRIYSTRCTLESAKSSEETVSYYWVLEARYVLKRVNTEHSPQGHKSQVTMPNTQRPLDPHACVPSIPFLRDLCAAAHHSRSTPASPWLLAPSHGAASPCLQSAIFPNPTSYSRPASRTTASRGAASVRRVIPGRGRRFPSTGTSASRASPGHTRSPADSKVDAARELRHSPVRCPDGILGRRAGPGASTTFRSSPPNPIADAAVQQDLVDIKVIFLSLRSR